MGNLLCLKKRTKFNDNYEIHSISSINTNNNIHILHNDINSPIPMDEEVMNKLTYLLPWLNGSGNIK